MGTRTTAFTRTQGMIDVTPTDALRGLKDACMYMLGADVNPALKKSATEKLVAALDAARAALAVAEKDESELVAALREMKELFRFALTCTSPEIAREGMAFVRKAESILAKHADPPKE